MPTPAEAVARLAEGNRRFATGHTIQVSPREVRASRINVAQEQHPFAAILGCADSRVAPENVFDQGLGELFDVRTAGHVVGPFETASLEYAVHHLHVPLIVVLGHERCGAVTAAVEGGDDEPGAIAGLLDQIRPAVKPGVSVDEAVRANALMVRTRLREESPILSAAIKAGELEIIAMRYDLDTGRAEVLQ